MTDLKLLVQRANDDVLERLRKVDRYPLDPLGCTDNSLANLFPQELHLQTLKAYFGEIFAGLTAERFSPFGEDGWKVPAFLFRFHDIAFRQLEKLRLTGETPGPIFGQRGDDCLAFQRDDTGRIIRSLVCEAKCTAGHRSTLISGAHTKVSADEPIPLDIWRLVEVLLPRDDPISLQWAESLQKLRQDPISTGYERCDLVAYICGRPPVKGRRRTWIPTDKPHPNYTARRRLQAVEAHLHDVNGLVREVYGKEETKNGPSKQQS